MAKADKEKQVASVDKDANLQFWRSVCETDPAITKEVKYGARKFTSVCAQHQIKNATREWGPYGGKWGVKDIKWGYVGAADNSPIELTIEAVFYSPLGEFQISTDIKYEAGGECRKKALTDLMTKALSKVGFNSDIFEGKFDDNKYVTDMKKKYGDEEEPTETKPKPPKKTSGDGSPSDTNITPDGLGYLGEIRAMLQGKLDGGMTLKDAGNILLSASSFDGDKGHVDGWSSLSKLTAEAHEGIATEARLKVIRDKIKSATTKGE